MTSLRNLVRNSIRVLFGAGALLGSMGLAAAAPLFTEISGDRLAGGYPQPSRVFEVDVTEMRAVLDGTPGESFTPRVPGLELTLPLPDGTSARFEIWESSVMHPDLAAKYPEIRTYSGRGLDDRTMRARLDLTPHGFHAMIRSTRPIMFIDPIELGNNRIHVSHFKRSLADIDASAVFSCEVVATPSVEREIEELVRGFITSSPTASNGTELRTYRTAIAATGEYTTFHGGTVPLGLAAINTSLNRVTGIYEQEFSIRMELIPNNDLIVYTNGATDPYSNGNGSAMLNQNQSNLDSVIGNANYDIGHVFSTGGGGIAGLAVVCRTGQKARGVTGLFQPIGDPFDVDYVAHEMGHQFGGGHSFNGNAGACAGNRSASTAYEPGSGSTIMSYAGICSPQNIATHSHPEFHGGNFDQIVAYTQHGSGNNCPVITATGNTPPVAVAGNVGLTIPIETPFILYGVGSDADGDPVTYSWEEFDLGPAGHPDEPVGDAPIFRSFTPKDREWRMFPRRADVRTNVHTMGEILPTYARDLRFRLTVRDNLGGIGNDMTTIDVTDLAGPFLVTSVDVTPWIGGEARTITWDVAGTDAAPISCATVNIKLSTNDGEDFTELLVADTPNDGSEQIVVPAIPTTLARVLVEPVGNVFLDMNNEPFEITGGVVAVGDVAPATLSALTVQPNPFTNRTRITFALPKSGSVALDVYDAVGRRVSGLLHGTREAGVHIVDWDGRDANGAHAAPGVYFVRMESQDDVHTVRSLLLR